MMNNRLQPLGASTIASQHVVTELFAEDAPAAQYGIAPEPTRHDRQLYPPATER